jgi:hypothetical protein
MPGTLATMTQWLLLEPAYYQGAQLKAATEFNDDFSDVQGMIQAGMQLRNLTLYPLIPAAKAVVNEIRKAQEKGRRDHELYHLFAALAVMADNASGGGGGAGLSNASPQDVSTAPQAGTGPLAAREDHVHAIPFATLQSVLGAASSPVAFNAQQLISLGDPTTPQAAATKAYVDAQIAANPGGGFSTMLQWASDSLGLSATPRYLAPGYGDSLAPHAPPKFRVTEAGSLKHLRVKHNTAGDGAVTYTVRINNAPTPITCTVNANANDAQDLLNAVAVNTGDEVSIQASKVPLTLSPYVVTATLSLIASTATPPLAPPYVLTIGDGVATSILVTHNLNSFDVNVEVYELAPGKQTVICTVGRPSANAVLLSFTAPPSLNSIRAMVSLT